MSTLGVFAVSRWAAVIDATKTRGKQGEGESRVGVRGGDKQSWVGGCLATINQVPD